MDHCKEQKKEHGFSHRRSNENRLSLAETKEVESQSKDSKKGLVHPEMVGEHK